MSSRDKRKWIYIYKSYFNILEGIGYTTKSSSSDDTISQLILAFVFFAVLSILFIVLTTLPAELKDLGIKDEFIKLIANILTSPLTQLTGIILGFDMIKEVIQKEVKALERQFPKHEEVSEKKKRIEDLEKEVKTLKKNKDINIIKELRLSVLAYLYSENLSNREKIKSIVVKEYSDQFPNGYEEVDPGLKKRFTDDRSRRSLSAAIRIIKEDSWNKLAASAALYALNPNDKLASDTIGIGKPGYHLFQDIFIYLYVWLVNRIDNNMTRANSYILVQDIGLRYFTPEQSPDIEKYESAFLYLKVAFDKGEFVKSIKKIQELTPEQSLSPEQIEICRQEVPLYFIELIEMLKTFERSSRESLSIEE